MKMMTSVSDVDVAPAVKYYQAAAQCCCRLIRVLIKMMKRVKKLIIFALLFSVLTVCFCFRASALVIYDGDFGFEVNATKHEARLVKYNGNGGAVQLPTYYRDYPVTVIGRNAFSGNETITELVFSSTNTTVEEYAFMNCTALETVTIPENVVSFGDRVFAGCTSLEIVTMLSDIVSMPTNMFSGCTALENLTINEKIAELSYGCFNGCSSLTNLDFVQNGVLLQSYAFNGTGAESVVLSDSLLAIPNYAFTNCPNLRYVTIPESVILIQPNAFDFETVTIRCFADSYAYTFAMENGISVELLERALLGDANGDSYVNINDVTAIQRHLAELEQLEGIYLYASDTNQDGVVDISDATALQMYLAEYDIPYPIGEIITV